VIKGFVGDNLTDEEINAVLARKDLITQHINNLIEKNGEENFLYRPLRPLFFRLFAHQKTFWSFSRG